MKGINLYKTSHNQSKPSYRLSRSILGEVAYEIIPPIKINQYNLFVLSKSILTIEWTTIEFNPHTNSSPTWTIRYNSNTFGENRCGKKTFFSWICIDISFENLFEKRNTFHSITGEYLTYCFICFFIIIINPITRIIFSLILN
jgi:hypothetical protein